MAGEVLKLTYLTENNRLTIHFLSEGQTPITVKYSLEQDTLHIWDSFGKDTIYIRVKD